MLMRKICVLAGLLLCSIPVLAQGKKTNELPKSSGHFFTVPVTPALPGEEKLSARERAERDLLMPVRRQQAALTLQEAKQASAAITAQGVAAAEANAGEEAKKAPQTTADEPHVVFSTTQPKAAPAVRKTAPTAKKATSTTKKGASAKKTTTSSKKSASTAKKKPTSTSSARKSTAQRKPTPTVKKKTTRRR
jgi:hypothetical protein